MFMLPTISLRIERWKFNKDYGVYVSTLGHFKDRHKRLLPIKINDRGYCLVKTEAPKQPWKLAHRIVMLTWKPIPDAENLTVDHLDHNKRDNSLTNLEWVTSEENQRRATADYMPSTGTSQKKPISIFSPKISIEEYRSHLIGYELNNKKCLTVDDIFEEAKKHIQTNEQELKNRIKNIVKQFETRHKIGGGTGLRIKKGLLIVPIYDTTSVLK